MKLRILLIAMCLLLPISSTFGDEIIGKEDTQQRLRNDTINLTEEAFLAGQIDGLKETILKGEEAKKILVGLERVISQAKAGDAQSQYILGQLFLSNTKLPHGAQVAEKWLLKSSDQGYKPAEQALSKLYKDIKENLIHW